MRPKPRPGRSLQELRKVVWFVACALLCGRAPANAAGLPDAGAVDVDAGGDLWGQLSPGSAKVSTAHQLLQALQDNVGDIQMTGNVELTPAVLSDFQLPIRVGANATILVHADESISPDLVTINWGQSQNVLWLAAGSTLAFAHISLENPASYLQGRKTERYELKGSFLWPTVTGESGHSMVVRDSHIQQVVAKCDVDAVRTEVERLQEMLGSNDTTQWLGGLEAWVELVPAPIPIYDSVSMLQVGVANYVVANSTMGCIDDGVPTPAPALAPAGATSAGTPYPEGSATAPWVWAVVGTAGALAALACAAAAAYTWHRWRRLQTRAVAPNDAEGAAKPGSGGAGGTPSTGTRGSSHPDVGGAAAYASLHCMATGPPASLDAAAAGTAASGAGVAAGTPPASSLTATPPGRLSAQGSMVLATPCQPSTELHDALLRNRYGAVDGVVLGELLGRGAFAKVYRGRWQGAIVAVKVIERMVRPGQASDALSREPLLSASLSHPNIVSTHHISVVKLISTNSLDGQPASSSQGAGAEEAAPMGTRQQQQQQDWPRQALPAPQQPGAAPQCGAAPGSPGSGSGGSGGSGRPLVAGREPASDGLALSAASPSFAGRMRGSQEGNVSLELVPPDQPLQPGHYETWLVTEYCDLGSLDALIAASLPHAAHANAAAAGAAQGTRVGGSCTAQHCGGITLPRDPNQRMVCVLRCLLDIAGGLDYLHTCCSMVHSDLKPGNVLLRSVRNDRRGFVCKLGDFGLSRLLSTGEAYLKTGTIGTASFAAPELLTAGRLSPASDVYSLGLIMWQLVADAPLHAGCNPMQIIYQVTQQRFRPPVPPPPACPVALCALMQRCWSQEPEGRPTAAQVVAELRGMLRAVGGPQPVAAARSRAE